MTNGGTATGVEMSQVKSTTIFTGLCPVFPSRHGLRSILPRPPFPMLPRLRLPVPPPPLRVTSSATSASAAVSMSPFLHCSCHWRRLCRNLGHWGVTLTGNASIKVPERVNVTFYIEGNTDIAGNGIANKNTRPKNLRIYGVTPSVAGSGTMKIAGNGGFSAAVYAPSFDIEIKGGGNDKDPGSSAYGSIVGNSVFMNGVTSFHFDES